MGWIGVDLDGTLAHFDGWSDGKIGKPIPAMIKRVMTWLAEGKEVRIVTARVADCNEREWWKIAVPIMHWCIDNLGCILPITHEKDYEMIQMWDDRAVQVGNGPV